MYTLSLSL